MNIGTPGIIKFFWPKDNVEIKYSSLFDIPVMDINKRLFNFDEKVDQEIIFVHIKDSKADRQAIAQIQEKAKVKVCIIPDQNSLDSFEDIKKVYPAALGKMIFNGPDAHPLSKYLRKGCYKLYDFEMFGSRKALPLDIFHMKGERINYYTGATITDFINQL